MDGGLKSRGEDASEGAPAAGLAEALDDLAEALGVELEHGEGPSGLASRVAALSARARELAAGERRARQAAASFRAASLALSRSPASKASTT